MAARGRQMTAAASAAADELASSIDRLFRGMEGARATLPDEPVAREMADALAAEPLPAAVAPAPEVVEPVERPATEELDRAVAAYLDGPDAGGGEAADRVQATSRALERVGEAHAVAGAVERLAVASESGDHAALELARRLLTPAVGSALALELGGAARDEARREGLTRTVARLGAPMAAPLGDALTDSSERVERRAYVEALTALGEDALPVLREMVADSRWFVVRNAMLVLRETAGEEGVEHFTAALAHEDPRVRKEALLSLAHVGGDRAALLVPSKIADPDPEVREAAAKGTGVLRVQRGQRPLLEQLDEEESPDVQEAILLALGHLGDPGAVPAIEKRAVPGIFGRKPPTAVRVAAYRALWAIGTPHAAQLVEEAEKDRDTEVREAAKRLRLGKG